MTAPTSPPQIFIGLMSGTSMDGVDGVLADFSNNAIRTLAAAFVAFPPALRSALMALQAPGDNEIEREAIAANQLTACYAECVANLLSEHTGAPVQAIAVHGQTIRHRPELGYTRQTNNPALLAELTGIDVIADFRSRDVAAGGQGAPLVPAFHHAQFAAPGHTRAVVNIGGIANVSLLQADGQIGGFDTGPGNVLMDGWIARHRGMEYDAGGAWAASGTVNQVLLQSLLEEPYFALPAPKSTGRDLFHLDWLDARLAESNPMPPQDVQATLTQLTAVTIAHAIRTHAREAEAVYVCGGGAYNDTLLRALQAALGETIRVASTEVLGVAPNRVEALAFAWLGYRFSRRETGNLPDVTGARDRKILGALYPA